MTRMNTLYVPGLLTIVLLALIIGAVGCTEKKDTLTITPPAAEVVGQKDAQPSADANPSTTEEPMATVLLETTKGNITIELAADMPITAGNFKTLVEKGFYNGVIFHRVIPNFMVQGGDPTGTGMGGPGYNIKDEFTKNNRNNRGTISMANAGPNTGGSQFFLNVVDNNFLDTKHPVFGKITKGMDVVDAIVNTPRDRNDRPKEEVKIIKATIVK